MFQTPGQKGKEIISGAISSFQRTIEDLNSGIEFCKAQISHHTEEIDHHEGEILTLNQHIESAEIVSQNISKIITKE